MNTQKIKLLNPFSISLEKNPFMEISSTPVYSLGDFRVYKYSKDHYVHTFKNIVIAERVGINKEMISNLHTDTRPPEASEARMYFDYERSKETMLEGIEHAKKLNFTIK